jgi:hypothetical protein
MNFSIAKKYLYLYHYWYAKIKDMLIVSSREFRDSQKKYLDLAKTDRIIIKRNNEYIELVSTDSISENPSPSNDPFFDDRRNIEELKRRITALEEGLIEKRLFTKEDQKRLLEL